MTLYDMLHQVEKLSYADKLALIEATARMLRQASNNSSQAGIVAESALFYRVDKERPKMTLHQMLKSVTILSDEEKFELLEALLQMLRASSQSPQEDQQKASAQDVMPTNPRASALHSKEYYLAQSRRKMAVLAAQLSSRPNPTPEQMLPYGLFKSMNFTEEDFRAAGWHPTDEKMDGE